MIGRLSQRKAVQRLSGVSGAAAAVAYALALTGAGQLVGAGLYADGSSSPVAFKLDTAGNAFPANFRPSGFAVSPSGEWLAVNVFGGSGVTSSNALRIFRRTGDKAFTYFATLFLGFADEIRFISNTAFILSSSGQTGGGLYYTYTSNTWAATSYGAVLDGDYAQFHGGLGISADGLFRCAMGRYASDTWNMGFCGIYSGARLPTIGYGQTIDQFSTIKSMISPPGTKVAMLCTNGTGDASIKLINRSGNSWSHVANVGPQPSGFPIFAQWISDTQLFVACTPYNIPPTNQQPYFGKMLSAQICDISANTIGAAAQILNISTLFAVPGNKVMDLIKLPGTLYGIVTDDFQFAVVSIVGTTVTLVGASALTFPKPYAAAFYRAS